MVRDVSRTRHTYISDDACFDTGIPPSSLFRRDSSWQHEGTRTKEWRRRQHLQKGERTFLCIICMPLPHFLCGSDLVSSSFVNKSRTKRNLVLLRSSTGTESVTAVCDDVHLFLSFSVLLCLRFLLFYHSPCYLFGQSFFFSHIQLLPLFGTAAEDGGGGLFFSHGEVILADRKRIQIPALRASIHPLSRILMCRTRGVFWRVAGSQGSASASA